jgi:hypothetical protein
MEKKSLFILGLVTVFTLAFLTPRAQAGPEERYRWEGFAIGVGAALVGSAILHSYNQSRHEEYIVRHVPAYYGPDRRGHWEMQKEWIPPTYKRAWNPGHYDNHRHWIAGQWIRIVDRPGYWVEKKVWVRYR